MNIVGIPISSLGSDETEEEQRTGMLMATAPEGYNGVGEGLAIKIKSVLQTRPSSRTLIETKKAVTSHVVVVFANERFYDSGNSYHTGSEAAIQ